MPLIEKVQAISHRIKPEITVTSSYDKMGHGTHGHIMQTQIQVREKHRNYNNIMEITNSQRSEDYIQNQVNFHKSVNSATLTPGAHKFGKKTVIHTDFNQYNLYMEMKQMRELGKTINEQKSSLISAKHGGLTPISSKTVSTVVGDPIKEIALMKQFRTVKTK